MFSICKSIEISLYSLLCILPFMSLTVYCFRRHLRFSKAGTDLLSAVLCILQVLLAHWDAFTSASPMLVNLAGGLLFAVYVFTIVNEHYGRILFVILVFINAANLVMTASSCLAELLFNSLAVDPPIWSLCLCIVIFHLLFTVPLIFYVRKYFTSSIPIQTTAWIYVWSIPAIFYIIGFFHLYACTHTNLRIDLTLHNTIFLVAINGCAFVVYHITVTLLSAQKKTHQIKQENHLLNLRNIQYDNLQQRIDEARQAKHDVRHHVLMAREYLHSGKLQELEAYLDAYTESLPETRSLIYCQNHATNAVLGYFHQQAQRHGITMDVFVQLPETIAIPETTISVVLGNLLENAVEACRNVRSGEKRITVRGKYQMASIFFDITNTYSGTLQQNKSGDFQSTKSTHRGLGLHSVSQIAQSQGGMLELEAKDGIFRASVLLPE